MERQVALKTLPAAMTRDTQSILRFHREVKAAAKLTHPNIVAAYDADEANGVHYFVMEYVEGIDLSAVVKKQGVLEVDVAVDYILQAAKGLEFAHNKGVIHRDIKPANLLLDNDGCVKILDMGLARIEDEAHEIPATQLTQDGSVMGTVDYMAPEQAKDTHTADARSDIYSLGCSLYYLLTGESVYRGSTMVNRIMAHQNDPIPSLTGKHILISQDVDAVFQKMVAKKPEDRFQSMSEVIVAIDNCIQMKSSSTVATEPSEPELHKFLQSQRMASSQTVVMSADAMTAEKPLTDTQNESLTSGFLNHTLGGTSYQPLAKRKQSIGKRGGIIAGVVLASLILIAGIVLKVDTAAGTIILEVDQPELAGAVVSVDEQQKITIKTGKGTEPIEVVADEKTHTLQVTKGGFETFTKQFIVKAGGKETIKVRLEPLKVAEKKVPPAGTPAKSHYALRFKNDSDCVTLPLKHETAGDLTVEAWVTIDENSLKPQNFIAIKSSLISFFIGNSTIQGKEMQWNTTVMNDGQFYKLKVNSKVEFGKRTNIVVTYKGNVAQIYVNGHKKGEMNFKRSELRNGYLTTIGWKDNLNFKGSIDEVRFSNVARYTEDFTPDNHFKNDEHTMALYHFDEGSGDVLKDSSGNGHHGKIVGAKWVKVDDELQGSMVPLAVAEKKMPSAGTPAKSHSAIRFQNDSDRVVLPLKHETAGDLTVEAWVTIDENSNRPLRIIANGSSLTSFGIGYSKAEGKEKEWSTSVSNNGQFQVLQTDSKVEFGKRTNIAVTYKGNVAQIYVNGHKKGEMNFNGSNIHTDEFITIGNRYKGPPIKGSIDEVRFSNTARYSEDFTPTDHFENDKNTLALYHFDEGTGDVLKDSSGNGHDGKIVGAKWVEVEDELQVVKPATTGDTPMTDREVAEWVIGMGGWVNTGGKSITKIEQLPTEPFVINFLDLKGTSVKDDDLKRLAGLKTLPKLNLENTLISDTGLQYLKDIPLNYISLIGTQITDKGFGYLSNMPSLTTLYVGSTAISNSGVEQLKDMKQLEKLSFTNTQIDGVGLGHLKDLKDLKILGLESTSISDVDLQHLHGLKILIVLGLSNCKIADSGLAYLKDLKNLKVLSLDSTPITDEGLKHLSGLKMLQTLELQKTKVTPQGIASLQKALPNCKIVSDFETKPIMTSDSPMTDREIAEWVIGMGGGIGIGFKLNYKIEELPTEPVIFNSVSLKNASFEDHDLQRLAKLKTLKYLFLESTSISDTGFQYLKQMQNLEEIFLDYTKITDEGLLHLRGLQNLRVLRLSKTKITGEGLGHLKDLPRLHTIDVNRAAITNSGMKAMGDLKQLTSLNISFNSQVDETGLGYIEGLTKLEKLFAHLVPKITDEGLKHLQGMKQLETLTLSSTGITTTGLEQLTKHESLSKLDLTNCKITDSGLEHLQDLKNLRDLRLDLTPVSDAGLQHLYGLKKLENLDLRETKVTPQGIADLQKVLPNCKIESDFGTKPPATKAP
ncbi:protein kinase domain-containing protein [Gimesia algae]|nr:LamG-like jellyroll fold domain-containing protein [Gimesia algae]